MVKKYTFEKLNKETMAQASAVNLPISLKKSVETCKSIRNKKVSSVIDFLNKVIDQKAIVAYTRYNSEMPHRKGKGISAGGYPVNVAKEILKLVVSAQKNAKEKELSDDLYVINASARKGSARYHSGRYPGRKIKSTNIEIIVGLKDKKKDNSKGGLKKND